ncbi:MAG: flagellar biosynthesis protein FlhF [bacterium]
MMKYKTYVAPTLQRALLQMALDLGKDALLVSHRNVRKGGIFGIFGKKMIEVTAALPFTSKPKPEKPQVQPLQPQTPPYQPQVESDQPQIPIPEPRNPNIQPQPQIQPDIIGMIQKELSEIKQKMTTIMEERSIIKFPGKSQEAYMRLINNDVEKEVAEKIIKQIVAEAPPNILEDEAFVESRVLKYIAGIIKTEELSLDNGNPKIITLIGPTGVGKTTTLAKIAADFAFEKHKKVSVITVDTYRIAAAEQLKTYTDILGIPLEVVYFPSEFKKAIETHSSSDLILIDTAGRSQRNSIQMAELKAFISQAGYNLENCLILSSTTKYKELLDIADNFKRVSFHKVIFTKTDEAVCFGGILSLSSKIEQPIIYITTGQNVPEDIEQANPTKLAKMVFGTI